MEKHILEVSQIQSAFNDKTIYHHSLLHLLFQVKITWS